MKSLIVMMLAVMLAVGLGACETMKGLGRDISKAGDAIEGAAKK